MTFRCDYCHRLMWPWQDRGDRWHMTCWAIEVVRLMAADRV